MVLCPEENASRRQFHRHRLNWTKLVLSQHLRAWWQLFEFVDMRAESIEDGRPLSHERVGAAGRRSSNRSRHPELAPAGIAADSSSECYGRHLHAPAASPCRHARLKRRPRKFDLPRHRWRWVVNMQWRAAE